MKISNLDLTYFIKKWLELLKSDKNMVDLALFTI